MNLNKRMSSPTTTQEEELIDQPKQPVSKKSSPNQSPTEDNEDQSSQLLLTDSPQRRRTNNKILKRIKSLPIKTTIAAVTMLLLGSLFLLFGLICVFWCEQKLRSLGWFIVGTILFTPGTYTVYIIYNVIRGKKGYDIDEIPSYDE